MKNEMPNSGEQTEEIVWEQVASEAAWSKRDSMGAVVFDGKMWLLGGWTPKRVNDVWYSSDGVNWHQATKEAPWGKRNVPCAVVYDNKIWIMGGAFRPEQGMYARRNDVWYSRDGKSWQQAIDNAPWSMQHGRAAATAVVYDDRIWIMGGNASDFTHYNDVWSSQDGKEWEQVTDKAPWSARAMHSSVVFNNKMWILGGGVYNTAYVNHTQVDYNDVWCSSDGKEWYEVTGAAEWTPRRFHCSVVYDNKIWVIGGYHQPSPSVPDSTGLGNRNDIWYSSDGKSWQEARSRAPWAIRHAPSCLVYKDSLWVIGGCGQGLHNDVWKYTRLKRGS